MDILIIKKFILNFYEYVHFELRSSFLTFIKKFIFNIFIKRRIFFWNHVLSLLPNQSRVGAGILTRTELYMLLNCVVLEMKNLRKYVPEIFIQYY